MFICLYSVLFNGFVHAEMSGKGCISIKIHANSFFFFLKCTQVDICKFQTLQRVINCSIQYISELEISFFGDMDVSFSICVLLVWLGAAGVSVCFGFVYSLYKMLLQSLDEIHQADWVIKSTQDSTERTKKGS